MFVEDDSFSIPFISRVIFRNQQGGFHWLIGNFDPVSWREISRNLTFNATLKYYGGLWVKHVDYENKRIFIFNEN